MKSFKWMLAALLAVTVCTPLMAQNHKDLGAKIQRQIQLQKQKQQSAKCWHCGEKITSEYQRCAADCDVFCNPENEPQAKTQTKAVTPAKSQTKQAKSLEKCWRCGEEITSESKRCPADCDVYCAPESNTQQAAPKTQKKAKSKKVKKAVKQDYETCPECHAVYDDDYYFHGIHYCGFNH